eukprot:CAMPEP_0201942440 /NCGR_PEP_ID=MMETSP0903-20130614/49045_1 /ASSEMBLY_ACC=CAM_ASM_000552 /TAXON_ID=420261 /ORGANISM="Thalassiosira antarctica, Strain CCMP982" /LENGTH=498 /DNA_ID=CAMNT_0048484831 /DNA_START=48 /DNA_END=1541 /DNA_ORIENTATION=-
MVKFGRHLQFYLESDEQSSGSEPFIVPYTDIRENIVQSQAHFSHAWRASLKAASDDYTHRVRLLWEQIFDGLFRLSGLEEQEHRGLPHDDAIQLYVSTMSESRSRDLFTSIKKIHSSASMNTEALRKLVKKFDKGAVDRDDDMLTSTLIPELYSAPFMAYPTLEGHIETLRDSLAVEEEEEELDEDSVMHSIRQRTTLSTKDSTDVKRRADELSWLHDMLARSIPDSEIPRLVAHRGFHCPRDNSGKRPLENSLSAFESAWSAGIHLCECDVALTKDEQLVLAHDEDFSRLALDPSKICSKKKVGDLTMKEIISLTFKSGSRPPLLLDVLRSAQAIGGFARLVIEIKPGNQEACTALIRLFRQYPELIERCAVIMSFDAYTMHKLRSELNELASSLMAASDPLIWCRSESPHNVRSFEDDGSQVNMPGVLLLTVAKEPQEHYELSVGVSDLTPVHSWLQHEGKQSLDGVYLQYQPEMLHPNGIAALRALGRQCQVGVW